MYECMIENGRSKHTVHRWETMIAPKGQLGVRHTGSKARRICESYKGCRAGCEGFAMRTKQETSPAS